MGSRARSAATAAMRQELERRSPTRARQSTDGVLVSRDSPVNGVAAQE
jgi:hypothetical protein